MLELLHELSRKEAIVEKFDRIIAKPITKICVTIYVERPTFGVSADGGEYWVFLRKTDWEELRDAAIRCGISAFGVDNGTFMGIQVEHKEWGHASI